MLGIKYPDAVARAVYPFKYLRRVDRIAKCIVKRQFFLYAKHICGIFKAYAYSE